MKEHKFNVKLRTITSENDVNILKEEITYGRESGSGSDGGSGSGSSSGSGDEPEPTYIEIDYPLNEGKTMQHLINKCVSTATATLSGKLTKRFWSNGYISYDVPSLTLDVSLSSGSIGVWEIDDYGHDVYVTYSVTGGSKYYTLAHGPVDSPYDVIDSIECTIYNSKDNFSQPQTVHFQVEFFLSSAATPGIREFDFRCY